MSQLAFPAPVSAALSLHPLGAQPGPGCRHPVGGMEALEFMYKLAKTENLSSGLGQQCNKDKPCRTGVLLLWKLEASYKQLVTSWLSLLLCLGGDFVNLEKAKNTEIYFFLHSFLPIAFKEFLSL